MTIQDHFKQFYNMQPYFDINEEQWEHIKETYPKEEVRLELAKCLMTYSLPYAEISEKDAYLDFMKLKGIRWNELLVEGEWFSRSAAVSKYPLTYEGVPKYFRRLNSGNNASNYFQQANRWMVDSAGGPGPDRTWQTEKFMVSLMGSAYSLKMPRLGKSEIRTMIGLRKYICAQFKPSVAKSFYDYYKAENVLDFSMGWGDRLAGFYASEYTKNYVGLDPRIENHPIYNQQAEFYSKHLGFFEDQKNTTFHISPAEDFDFSQYADYFDLVFTSPPYFDIERYSKEDTQSWVRYKDINDWNSHFLHKTLGNIISAVKKGGIIAVNISDVYSSSKGADEKTWLEITNPMIDFLTNNGMEYLGVIGMEMAQRPNSGGAGTASNTDQYGEDSLNRVIEMQDKQFCEPVWIVRKNN